MLVLMDIVVAVSAAAALLHCSNWKVPVCQFLDREALL